MKRAFCLIRSDPVYRREAFDAGLRAHGYSVASVVPPVIDPGDVLVIWNRYDAWDRVATRVEQSGGIVIVAENAYIGPGGVSPHDMEPRCWYALAVGGHNGRGTWPVGDSSRWDALGIELKPWRTEGKHILVAPNRPFGQPGNVMPADWASDVARRLRAVTDREIRTRPHPGNGKPQKPLADDLRDAWACAIWSSSVGVQALIAGVPVICEAPLWICKGAALGVEVCRKRVCSALAWAQWSVDEIATGEPFARLIEHATNREAVAA